MSDEPKPPYEARDVQKVAVQALQEATTALQQNELVRAIPDALPDALIVVGEDGVIEYCNGQFEFMFGYHRSEVLGKTPEMFLPMNLRAAHINHRTRYLNAPAVREMGERLNLEAVRKNGSIVRVLIRLSPLVVVAGIFTIAVIRRAPDVA